MAPRLREVAALPASADGSAVWCCAWDAAGRRVLTCGADRCVRVWALVGGVWECVGEVDAVAARTVRRVALSPCGRRFAAAAFDGTVVVYEEQGAGGEWVQRAVLEGHESEVKAVAWGAGGELLATCGRDRTVWVWAAEEDNEFDCAAVLSGHAADVKCVAWHPTEPVLLSASYDNTVRVWADEMNEDDWHCTQTLGVAEASDGTPGASVVASPDGGGAGELPGGHSSTVWGLAFDTAGAHLVTCGADRHVALWWRAGSSDGAHSGWTLATAAPDVHHGPIYTVDWQRAGDIEASGLVATGGGDDAICLLRCGGGCSHGVCDDAADAMSGEAMGEGPTAAGADGSEGSGEVGTAGGRVGIAGWLGTAFGRSKGSKRQRPQDRPSHDGQVHQARGQRERPAFLEVVHRTERAHAADVNCVAWRPAAGAGSAGSDVALASVGDDGVLRLWALEEC